MKYLKLYINVTWKGTSGFVRGNNAGLDDKILAWSTCFGDTA